MRGRRGQPRAPGAPVVAPAGEGVVRQQRRTAPAPQDRNTPSRLLTSCHVIQRERPQPFPGMSTPTPGRLRVAAGATGPACQSSGASLSSAGPARDQLRPLRRHWRTPSPAGRPFSLVRMRFARLIERRGRVLGGPSVLAASGSNLKPCLPLAVTPQDQGDALLPSFSLRCWHNSAEGSAGRGITMHAERPHARRNVSPAVGGPAVSYLPSATFVGLVALASAAATAFASAPPAPSTSFAP